MVVSALWALPLMSPVDARRRGRSTVRSGSRSPLGRRVSSTAQAAAWKPEALRLERELADLRKQVSKQGSSWTAWGGARTKRWGGEPRPHHWSCQCGFKRNFAERLDCWACRRARPGVAVAGSLRGVAGRLRRRGVGGAGWGGSPSAIAPTSSATVRPGISYAAATVGGGLSAPETEKAAAGADGQGPDRADGAVPPAVDPGPTLAKRVATATALLSTARSGQEPELIKQLEVHLAQLKEAQQAERPLAARYQSAVDRAAVKKAALKAAEEEVAAVRVRLAAAEQSHAAALEAAEEADQHLEQLHQQLGEEAAAASGKAVEPGLAAPKTFGELIGEVHAVAAHSAGWLSGDAQAALENALSTLNRVHWALRSDGQLPPVAGGAASKEETASPPAGAGGGAVRSPSTASHRGCDRQHEEEPSRKAAKLGEEPLGDAAGLPSVGGSTSAMAVS